MAGNNDGKKSTSKDQNPQSDEFNEDLRSTEDSPLLSSTHSIEDEDGTASEISASSRDLWQEMERPWPATFERSISLLASPVMNASRVDHFTKSPKPGATPLAVARARKQYREGQKIIPPPGKGDDFLMGVARVKSLDFHVSQRDSKKPAASETRRKQERKAMEAKAYRENLLKKQQVQRDEEEGISMMSPGYQREKIATQVKREQKVQEATEAKATFSQSLFNMANILMGVGILGLPFVFRSAGWIGGFAVTFFFGFVTWRTSILIGRELNGDPRPASFFDDSPYKSPLIPGSGPGARMRWPIKSFPDIAREAFGETGCIILSSVLYFELFSCLSIFFVSLGDHLHSLFPTVSVTKFMIAVAVVLTIPTALLRTPRLLSYLSMVGTFATVAVVLSVFSSAVVQGDITEHLAESKGAEGTGPYRTMWKTSGLPLALGLIAYAFSGHAIVPSIYSSMERPQDYERMIDVTFLIVLGCSSLVACSGYYMFGEFVEDQVTISLAQNSSGGSGDLAMTMLTWLMVLTAFSKFTLTAFPLALGIEEIVAPYVPSDKVMDVAGSIIKLLLIVLSLAVAIFVPSFSFLCSLVGMICTMTVSVIFPAAAHLKLFGPKLSFGEKLLDWCFVVFGSVMAVVGTIATV